ncbi:MAG: site-specific DNA-methyltransferase [Phycisphaerales bacterium]|nr:site-specific DNA-methyltransferase [Phycisphaerales bacterium]
MPKPTPVCKVAPALAPLLVPIGKITADPANARHHPARSIDAIKASFSRYGQQKPIVIDDAGVTIAGAGQLEAARRLGWTHIAAVRSDLVGSDRVAYAIADNRTAELSEWDDEALEAILHGMSPEDMAFAGFTPDDLVAMGMSQAGTGAVDADQVPAPPDEATTVAGDVWILGNHRLMCGDSSKPADLDRLLAGQPIHLVNTDPPCNVKVEPRSNNAIAAGLSSFTMAQRKDASAGDQQSADLHRYPEKSKPTHNKLRAKDRPLANDFVTDQEFDRLLDAWFGNIARVLVPGGGFYIWGGYANCANYPPFLSKHELYFSQAIIWVKGHPVLTRKDFMGNHEWCFYGWREGGPHRFFGPKNVPDVWEVKKVNPQSMVHLTEKPVELARLAIEYSSKPGENVLDLFGGSGSTMMGAEVASGGRHAFLMELDRLYCDVIVTRWQAFTGRKATLEGDGRTFEELSAARKSQACQPDQVASAGTRGAAPSPDPEPTATDTPPSTSGRRGGRRKGRLPQEATGPGGAA